MGAHRVKSRRRRVTVRTSAPAAVGLPACRSCGCTDDDCSGCVERTGVPCHWVAPDLCSACAPAPLLARLGLL